MNLRDERGFVHIYLMGLFSMVCVIVLAMMLATFAGARKNAVAAYAWFTEAADFAAHTAVINGVTAANYEDAPQVETYFTDSFSGITQTCFSGGEFVPGAGSPFLVPIAFNESGGFTPYNQGDTLPDGSTAGADGFLINVTVPVFVGSFPFVGQQSINVPMSYYAEL